MWKGLREYPGYRISDSGLVQCNRGLAGGHKSKTAWRDLKPSLTVGGYAVVSLRNAQGKKQKKVHKLLWETFNGRIPAGHSIDHRDFDKTNNCLSNIRLASFSQNNIHNRKSRGRCKYKGVRKHHTKYEASISFKNNRQYLGRFDSQEEAALAYNQRALELFGEFAVLNGVD